jgi:hypothetical protein
MLIALLSLRIAYGAALLIAPGSVSKRWLGPLDEPAEVGLRGLGAREVLLHGLALRAALKGNEVLPYLAASIAGDVSDIASTYAGRKGLPKGSPLATLVVAGGSAALTGAVAAKR